MSLDQLSVRNIPENNREAMLVPPIELPCKVYDICGGRMSDILRSMMDKTFLGGTNGQRRLLPPALLSDEAGLRIWRDITRLPDYYQTRDEISLLEAHGESIARHITEGCILIDLGCGDVRKIKPLLDKIEASKKFVQYFALDLSKPVLEESLRQLSPQYRYVQCAGLWGTYADALQWAGAFQQPKFFLSLGSIYGNDRFESAVAEFRKWSQALQPQDCLLIGVDAKDNAQEVWNSYHDAYGVFERFMRNSLEHSNRVLGCQWYNYDDWDVSAHLDSQYPVHHRFIFRAVKNVKCPQYNLDFKVGDEIDCYEVFKNGPDIVREAFGQAGLKEIGNWTAPSGTFHEYLLVSSQL